MPLPVVADTFQSKLIWTSSSAQRQATNDLYFHDPSGTQTEANLWTDLDASVTAGMWDIMGGTATRIDQVRNTPLDGQTASTTHTTAGAKWASGSAADPILQGCCVVTFRTARRGPSGRGRVYLPWVNEGSQTAGVLSSGSVATMQAAWTTFLAAMVTAGWELSVVSPTGISHYAVTSCVVRPYLKTQRRRSRR